MYDALTYLWWRLRADESQMGNIWDRLFLTMWLFISLSTLLG